MPLTADEKEVIDATAKLLAFISAGDFVGYASLCASDMTSFEPETRGHLVEGLAFHKYYFDLAAKAPGPGGPPKPSTIAAPHVRFVGTTCAIISYVRVVQNGGETSVAQESRVWQRTPQGWRNVHFHRSSL